VFLPEGWKRRDSEVVRFGNIMGVVLLKRGFGISSFVGSGY
jgi:hypothetical protein